MFEILSIGSRYTDVALEGAALDDLRTDVNRLCRERFRRIDRFTQLCLYGSASCVNEFLVDEKEGRLDVNTGLYIASGLASMANTVTVQQQLFLHREQPKPVNFINTLSNSAGYYVARNLQLEGQNIFVSRGDASMEAILQVVELDMRMGAVQQALVGVVDEAVEPFDQHRRRMGLPSGTALGEGSHWFLLQSSNVTSHANNQQIPALATITNVETFVDIESLEAGLHTLLTGAVVVHVVPGVRLPDVIAQKIAHLEHFSPPLGRYGARTAGVVMAYLGSDNPRSLLSICADKDGRFHVIKVVNKYTEK